MCSAITMFAQQSGYKSSPLEHMWLNVGNAGFTPGTAEFPCLAMSPAAVPYVAYVDALDIFNFTVSVKKLVGNTWQYVGLAGFDTVNLSPVNLGFSPSGELYVAYSDYYSSGREAVRKFDGTNWVTVGIPGFSGGSASYSAMAFNQQEEIFVAYTDYNHARKATVMKFDGGKLGDHRQPWLFPGGN